MSCESGGIHIEDGPLYQYDSDRRAVADDYEPGDLMDFAREGQCRALTVAAKGDPGGEWFPVPNKLLRCADGVVCWLRRDGATVASARFGVTPRAKPADYEYEETPTVGYRELEGRVAALERKLSEGGGGGRVQDVEPPLVLDGSTLKVDLSGVRGAQVTTGDSAPTSSANRGDSYIRTNGELWEFTDVPGTY